MPPQVSRPCLRRRIGAFLHTTVDNHPLVFTWHNISFMYISVCGLIFLVCRILPTALTLQVDSALAAVVSGDYSPYAFRDDPRLSIGLNGWTHPVVLAMLLGMKSCVCVNSVIILMLSSCPCKLAFG